MNRYNLNEEEIKYQFITPAIEKAGWDKNQIRLEYTFTDGRVIVIKTSYLQYYTKLTVIQNKRPIKYKY